MKRKQEEYLRDNHDLKYQDKKGQCKAVKKEGYTGEWEFLGETNSLTICTADYIVTH